jgi:hypothetical protein
VQQTGSRKGEGKDGGESGESSHQEASHFISFPVALCHGEKKNSRENEIPSTQQR